jgi:hypothetical protein
MPLYQTEDPTRHLANRPDHWRHRAAQLRALVWAGISRETKANLLKLADDYEKLAVRAQKRVAQPLSEQTPTS